MSLASSRPVVEGLFVQAGDEVRLVGSECNEFGVVTFPSQPSCPRCTSQAVSERLLAPRVGVPSDRFARPRAECAAAGPL